MNTNVVPLAEIESSKNQALYRRARKLIPGGTQLLSKRPELFAPDQWPPYYQEAKGCVVTDLDGQDYIDFSTNGIGSCLLGYADPDVSAAVIDRVRRGSMSSLNSPDEVGLASLLTDLHPWADQVRFARGGGEAMAIAVRIARAHSGRDIIAFCGYHGWCDWYLAANLSEKEGGTQDLLNGHHLSGLQPKGIPARLAGTALPFSFNKLEELEAITTRYGSRLAAVVMEPCRGVEPVPGFLEGVRKLCDQTGAALIFDEITTGFRLHYGGIHLEYGIEPDIAVFAKALGNGHPIAAIIGNSEWMDAAAGSFISSTYWTESVGLTAAIVTLKKMKQVGLAGHISKIGRLFRDGLSFLASEFEVPLRFTGRPAQTYLSFPHPKEAALLTLYTVRMLKEGYLAGSTFYPTFAHTPEHVASFLEAARPIFSEMRLAIAADDIEERIGGPVKHSGFQRLN